MEKHLRKSGLSFRIIHKTPDYPGMTFAVRKDLAPEIEKKLAEILYTLDQSEKGKEVLAKIAMPGYEKIDINELEKVRPFLPSTAIPPDRIRNMQPISIFAGFSPESMG